MSDARTADPGSPPPGHMEVQIAVRARGDSIQERISGSLRAHRAWRAPAVVLAGAVIAALAVGLLLAAGGAGNHGGARVAHAQSAGPAGIAAAFGYPLRCLTITISNSDPAYARAQVDRTRTCAGYRGYVNASFHLIDGTWRLVLDEGQLFVPNDLLAR